MNKLSAIVTTYNESEVIEETLRRLAFADEVLVVDSFSTDGTPEIAQRCGARVMQHEYESPAAQKNWAISQVTGDWVLIVDADEWMTDELAQEIQVIIRSDQSLAGYEIKRRNFFLGKEIKHSGWQNDWVTRLFRRGKAHYAERQVHEVMEVEGPVGKLNSRLLHHSYRSMDDYWRKLRRYAEWNATEATKRSARISPAYMLFHPGLRFVKAYLLQGGFLDGTHGLAVCMLTAMYTVAKDVRVWEVGLDEAREQRDET